MSCLSNSQGPWCTSCLFALLLVAFLSRDGQAARIDQQGGACGRVSLSTAGGEEVPLQQHNTPQRIIDFFLLGNENELPVLYLRLAEMAAHVDEIHIVEGSCDWLGEPRQFLLPKLMQRDPVLRSWRHKIVTHSVKVKPGSKWPKLQADLVALKDDIPGEHVILHGDLDEIVSRRVLKALRYCTPTGGWYAKVDMNNFFYSLQWTDGHWDWPPIIESHPRATKTTSLLHTHDNYITFNATHTLAVKGNQAGWHMRWMLNGVEGMVHKIMHEHAEGIPPWFSGHVQSIAELRRYLRDDFLPNPARYYTRLYRTHLAIREIPEVIVENLAFFGHFLRTS